MSWLTLGLVVGRVEHSGCGDEGEHDHEEVKVGVEEGQLRLYYIAGWQYFVGQHVTVATSLLLALQILHPSLSWDLMHVVGGLSLYDLEVSPE